MGEDAVTSRSGPDAKGGVAIEGLDVHAFRLPTDGPDGWEEDGTLRWDATTVIVVEAHAGGRTGIGYTYGDVAVAAFVESQLAAVLPGGDALAPGAAWHRMSAAVRNAGRSGVGAMAVSAVDVALWDLKARLLELPLFRVLPAFHDRVPVYGSGGFTNYPTGRLAEQLAGWVEQGIPRVKLKTSRRPEEDPRRLTAVREAIGADTELFADANGALGRKEALYWARRLAGDWDVRWFGCVLRAHLDLHRPARCRQARAAPHRPGPPAVAGGGHPHRRPGALVHGRLPRRRARTAPPRPGHQAPRRAVPHLRRTPAAPRPRLAAAGGGAGRHRADALPPARGDEDGRRPGTDAAGRDRRRSAG
ncbi:enolase C-terminal domain-like protein [Streptomyces axinellae]